MTSGGQKKSNFWRLVDRLWADLSSTYRAARLAGLCALGFIFSWIWTMLGLNTQALSVSWNNALVERAYIFFDLHDPFRSWWLGLLIISALVSSSAWFVERAASRYDRSARSASWMVGAAVTLLIGAALLIVASGIERRHSIYGEFLVNENRIVDRVVVLSHATQTQTRALGFGVSATEIEEDRVVLEVEYMDESLVLEIGDSAKRSSSRLTLRETRVTSGDETFVVSVFENSSGESRVRNVKAGETFGFSEDGSSGFVIADYNKDLHGLGPAILVGMERSFVSPSLPRDLAEEPFWVFLLYPEFDKHNRSGQYSIALVDVLPQREAIVAVVRQESRVVSIIGGMFFVIGCLGLLLKE